MRKTPPGVDLSVSLPHAGLDAGDGTRGDAQRKEFGC